MFHQQWRYLTSQCGKCSGLGNCPGVHCSLMRRPASSDSIEPKRRGAPRVTRERRENERFESLVDELSTAMALAPADAVDREIDSWLGKISKLLISTEAPSMSATRQTSRYARHIPGF